MENKKSDFRFKKEFGQNFIFDKNFLSSIIKDLNLQPSSCILEIGAGMGTLSTTLADNFKKVISFEIDKTLKEHLLAIESKYNNLQFVFKDILKENVKNIEEMFLNEKYYMVANLPYYITSQIIFRFLLDSENLKTMFVMVQKEVGERYCANINSREYGIPSVILNTFGDCKIIKNVNRNMFVPQPKVDSCIIQINIDKNKFDIDNVVNYEKFISSCFKMKRKTLYNNLCELNIDKNKCKEYINSLNYADNVRAENVTTSDYVKLYKTIYSCNK